MASIHQLMMLSICVIYLSGTRAAPTNTCLLQCMRDVLKCKRNENIGILSEMECCDKYTLCYFLCKPEAPTPPSCNSRGKRGSWNKRQESPYSWIKSQQIQDENLEDILNDYNKFYI